MLTKSFKKAQTKSTTSKSPSPIDNMLNGNSQRISPMHKTPGKKVDLNTLFNTFTPIKPASPVTSDPVDLTHPELLTAGSTATPIDFTKTAALRNIMGLNQNNKPPWPESNRYWIFKYK